MSTNSVSGINPTISLSTLLRTAPVSPKRVDTDGDSDSGHGGRIDGGGGQLFNALLAALTQFVAARSASTAAGAATSATPTTATAPTSTSTSTSTTTTAAGTVPGTLSQDLHAFLHDLFGALRQEGRPRDDDDEDNGARAATNNTPATTPGPVTTPAPVTTTSTGATTTPGVTTEPAAPAAAAATTPASTPSATTPVAPSVAGTLSGIAQYGQRGILAELAALIQDLGNAATGKSSTVSLDTLTDLNAAFVRLISDLGGTTAASTPAPAAQTPAPAAASSTGSTATVNSASTDADTAALQSFLGSFLNALQSSLSALPTARGNSINVTA